MTRTLLKPTLLLTVVLNATNFFALVISIIAAKNLAVEQFGDFASFMNLLLIFSAIPLGVQAVTAKRVSAHTNSAGDMLILKEMVNGVNSLLLLAAGLMLGASLLVQHSWIISICLIVTVWSSSLTAAFLGYVQGASKFRDYSIMILTISFFRTTLTFLAVQFSNDLNTFAIVFAVSALIPTALALFRFREVYVSDLVKIQRPLLLNANKKVVAFSFSLVAFFSLTVADVFAARALLSELEAGQYAFGAMLTKIFFLLPAAVVVVTFPQVERIKMQTLLPKAILFVFAIDALMALSLFAITQTQAMSEILDKYSLSFTLISTFVMQGVLLALIQLMIYFDTKKSGISTATLIWISVITFVITVGLYAVESVPGIIYASICFNLVLFVILLCRIMLEARSYSRVT